MSKLTDKQIKTRISLGLNPFENENKLNITEAPDELGMQYAAQAKQKSIDEVINPYINTLTGEAKSMTLPDRESFQGDDAEWNEYIKAESHKHSLISRIAQDSWSKDTGRLEATQKNMFLSGWENGAPVWMAKVFNKYVLGKDGGKHTMDSDYAWINNIDFKNDGLYYNKVKLNLTPEEHKLVGEYFDTKSQFKADSFAEEFGHLATTLISELPIFMLGGQAVGAATKVAVPGLAGATRLPGKMLNRFTSMHATLSLVGTPRMAYNYDKAMEEGRPIEAADELLEELWHTTKFAAYGAMFGVAGDLLSKGANKLSNLERNQAGALSNLVRRNPTTIGSFIGAGTSGGLGYVTGGETQSEKLSTALNFTMLHFIHPSAFKNYLKGENKNIVTDAASVEKLQDAMSKGVSASQAIKSLGLTEPLYFLKEGSKLTPISTTEFVKNGKAVPEGKPFEVTNTESMGYKYINEVASFASVSLSDALQNGRLETLATDIHKRAMKDLKNPHDAKTEPDKHKEWEVEKLQSSYIMASLIQGSELATSLKWNRLPKTPQLNDMILEIAKDKNMSVPDLQGFIMQNLIEYIQNPSEFNKKMPSKEMINLLEKQVDVIGEQKVNEIINEAIKNGFVKETKSLDAESLRDFAESKGIKTTAELNEALSEVKTAEDVNAIVDNSARLRTSRDIVEEGKISDMQERRGYPPASAETVEKLSNLRKETVEKLQKDNLEEVNGILTEAGVVLERKADESVRDFDKRRLKAAVEITMEKAAKNEPFKDIAEKNEIKSTEELPVELKDKLLKDFQDSLPAELIEIAEGVVKGKESPAAKSKEQILEEAREKATNDLQSIRESNSEVVEIETKLRDRLAEREVTQKQLDDVVERSLKLEAEGKDSSEPRGSVRALLAHRELQNDIIERLARKHDKLTGTKKYENQLYQTEAEGSKVKPNEAEVAQQLSEAKKALGEDVKIEFDGTIQEKGITSIDGKRQLWKITLNGNKITIDTIRHEVGHAGTTLLDNKTHDTLLKQFGWDGKGDRTAFEGEAKNESLVQAQERIADGYAQWRSNEANFEAKYKDSPVRQALHNFYNNLKSYWESTSNFLRGKGFYSASRYYSDLANGRLNEIKERVQAKENKIARLAQESFNNEVLEIKSSIDGLIDRMKDPNAPQHLAQMSKSKMTINSWINLFKKNGVKVNEILWTGIETKTTGGEKVTLEEFKSALGDIKVTVEKSNSMKYSNITDHMHFPADTKADAYGYSITTVKIGHESRLPYTEPHALGENVSVHLRTSDAKVIPADMREGLNKDLIVEIPFKGQGTFVHEIQAQRTRDYNNITEKAKAYSEIAEDVSAGRPSKGEKFVSEINELAKKLAEIDMRLKGVDWSKGKNLELYNEKQRIEDQLHELINQLEKTAIGKTGEINFYAMRRVVDERNLPLSSVLNEGLNAKVKEIRKVPALMRAAFESHAADRKPLHTEMSDAIQLGVKTAIRMSIAKGDNFILFNSGDRVNDYTGNKDYPEKTLGGMRNAYDVMIPNHIKNLIGEAVYEKAVTKTSDGVIRLELTDAVKQAASTEKFSRLFQKEDVKPTEAELKDFEKFNDIIEKTIENSQNNSLGSNRNEYIKERANISKQMSEASETIIERNFARELDKVLTTKVVRGKERGKTTAENRDALLEVEKLVEMTMEQKAELIDKTLREAGVDPATANLETLHPDITTKIDRINAFAGFSEMTKAGKLDAYISMKELISKGRTAAEEIRIERSQLRVETVSDVKSGLTASGQPLTAAQKTRINQKPKWLRALNDFDTRQLGWEHLLTKVLPYSEKAKNYLTDLVKTARRAEDAGLRTTVAETQAKYKEIMGADGRKLQRIMNSHTKATDTGIIVTEAGVQTELFLSPNQVAQLYLISKDRGTASTAETFKKMGWTEDTFTQLEKYMTEKQPKLKEWADWQQNEFFPKYYESVNEVYRKRFNMDLPKEEFYARIKRDVSAQEIDNPLLGERFDMASALNKSLEKRVQSTEAFKYETDINTQLMSYIVEMEHFKAFAEPIRQLRGVFGDNTLRRHIEESQGKLPLNAIDDFVNDLASGGTNKKMVSPILDRIRANFTRAVIGGNPVITLKQLTSIPAYLVDTPFSYFTKGMAEAISNPKRVADILGTSEMLKARYSEGWDRDVKLAMHQAGEGARLSGNKSVTDLLLMNVRFGDKAAIIMGGYGNYLYNYDKAIKAGATKDQAHKKAITEFERTTERMQQAGNIEDLSMMQRSGSVGKLFTMFMTAPNQYYRVASAGLRHLLRTDAVMKDLRAEAVKTGDYSRLKEYEKTYKDKKAYAVKQIAVAHFLLPAIFQFVASGLKWDNEDQMRALSLGSLNGLLIAGGWIESGFAALQGDFYFAQGLGIFDGGKDMINGMNSIRSMVEKDEFTADEFLTIGNHLMSAVSKTATGLPYEPAVRVAGGIKDYAEGETDDKRRLIGYSEAALKGNKENQLETKTSLLESTRQWLIDNPAGTESTEKRKEYIERRDKLKKEIDNLKKELRGKK